MPARKKQRFPEQALPCSHLHFCNIILKLHDDFAFILSKTIHAPSHFHFMVPLVVLRHVHRSDHAHPCPSPKQENLRVILESGEAVLGVTLPIVFISHPRTRITKSIDSFSILFSWNPVPCHNIPIQTPPRHAICCPRTLNPLRRRGKLHSARRDLMVVVLHSHNNN